MLRILHSLMALNTKGQKMKAEFDININKAIESFIAQRNCYQTNAEDHGRVGPYIDAWHQIMKLFVDADTINTDVGLQLFQILTTLHIQNKMIANI